MAWSRDGVHLATLTKSHLLKIFNPRSSSPAVSQMQGPEGSRGARVVWLDEFVVAVSGFDKYVVVVVNLQRLTLYYKNRSSLRTITLYDTNTSSPLSEIKTNVSPATLIPFFDVDTKLLFLTGKVISQHHYIMFQQFVCREMSTFLHMNM